MCGKIAPHLKEISHGLEKMKSLNTINIGPFVDISKTQELLDHKIGVAGNIDHGKLLPLGAPSEVKNAVKNAVKRSDGD